jgi:hypothetical protein
MRVQGLAELYAHFVGRTDELVRKFGTPLPPYPPFDRSCGPIHRDGQALLIVRLDHLWAAFCQALVTRSALGNVRTLGGSLLPRVTGVARSADVQRIAQQESRGQPPWHDASFTVRVARRLGLANYNEISIGIGAVSPVKDLIDVRNYVVHPNDRTVAAYRRITMRFGISSRNPVDFLALTQPGGATLFETWVSQLQIAAEAAVR